MELDSIISEYGDWNYLFYLEMLYYFDEMFSLVNSGDISRKQYEKAVEKLAEQWEELDKTQKPGRKKQQKNRLVEEDSEYENDACIKRLLYRRDDLLNNFTIVLYFQEMFIDLYWNLVSDIIEKKRIKVHSGLVSRLQNCKGDGVSY